MPLKPDRLTLRDLADLCLNHLAQNPEQLAEFMMQSGLTPDALRREVGTDGFAHGLVDYVVSNEPLLLAVAAAGNRSPESIVQVWARLHAHEQ